MLSFVFPLVLLCVRVGAATGGFVVGWGRGVFRPRRHALVVPASVSFPSRNFVSSPSPWSSPPSSSSTLAGSARQRHTLLQSFTAGYSDISNSNNNNNNNYNNVPEYRKRLARVWRETADFLASLENLQVRRKLLADAKHIVTCAWKNVSEGEVGKRGEELVFVQCGLLALVLLGVPPLVSFIIKLSGVLSAACGVYLMARGCWALRDNLTPFVSPVAGNQLVTTGVYHAVRHPIYTGLLCFCAGVAISSGSVEKAVVTAALAYVLDMKATKEEQSLVALHPLTYRIYAQQTTNRFLPAL